MAKRKTKAGRPTKYKPEYCEMLVNHFAKGHFLEAFAYEIDVIPETLLEWRKRIPEFSDAYKRALGAGNKFYTNLLLGQAVGKYKGGNAASAIFLTKVGLKWRDDEVEVDEVDGVEFYE